MREKLRDARGETLVEVLASVVVCTLSVMLLLGAVSASANIDLRAQEADRAYYAALSKAERQKRSDDEDASDECPRPGVTIAVESKYKSGAPIGKTSIEQGEETKLYFYGADRNGDDRLLSYAIDSIEPDPDETGGGG